ncbi:MAG: hypothetical protein P8Y29_06560 [Gemmatimonadota bacterium]
MRLGWLTVVATIAFAAACSDQVPLERTAPVSSSEPGEIVLPPSAKVPRASLPGFTPDTIRPEGMIAPDTLFEGFGGVALAATDLPTIVDGYREYYRDELDTRGSNVEGAVDPRLAESAKRRTANDWGYSGSGGWSNLVGQLPDEMRVALANRILIADRELVAELHRR